MGKWIEVIHKHTENDQRKAWINKNRVLVVEECYRSSQEDCWVTLNEGTKICVGMSAQALIEEISKP